MAVAITAAAARLATLGWLHPLAPDEREFFMAARWVAEGRVPYRDFWEHHTPLTWFLFAPLTRLTESAGADAVLLMRWAQIPIWIVTFWLTLAWMRNAGLSPFGRWSAVALALCSSLFMIPAVEFRVDPLGCLLIVAALVLMQRGTAPSVFGAGAALCLAAFANLRVGPVIVVTALLLRIVDPRDRVWRGTSRANWLFAGATAVVASALVYFLATGSLNAFIADVFRGNFIAGRYVTPVLAAFMRRLLAPFGLRIGLDDPWSAAALDVGGCAILLLGFIGLFRALARWRTPDDLFVIGFVQVVNLLFIAAMNTIYNYHFELVVILMLPLVALTIDRIPRPSAVVALLAVAWCMNLFASFFRGKELDLAYQDRILREVHARTSPDETVWGGMAWNLRREPAHRLWFLPDITHELVRHGYEAPYRLEEVLRDPPGAIVIDHFSIAWLVAVQRELAPYFLRHYVPLWRNLWVAAPNARLEPGASQKWVVPRDGTYRVHVSRAIGEHPWFRRPLYVASYQSTNIRWPILKLASPANDPRLRWWIDGTAASPGAVIPLRKGQRIAVASTAAEPLGVILLPFAATELVRQPPPGVTLEGATPRVTHWPDFGARIE